MLNLSDGTALYVIPASHLPIPAGDSASPSQYENRGEMLSWFLTEEQCFHEEERRMTSKTESLTLLPLG